MPVIDLVQSLLRVTKTKLGDVLRNTKLGKAGSDGSSNVVDHERRLGVAHKLIELLFGFIVVIKWPGAIDRK